MHLFAAAIMVRLTFLQLSLRSNQRITSLLQELVLSYTTSLTLLQSTQMPCFSVLASTTNENKKLDSAYHEAMKEEHLMLKIGTIYIHVKCQCTILWCC
jgi:hypothetical protein